MPPWAWHLLLFPAYLVASTTRHELAHAAAAWMLGRDVHGVWVLPHWRDELGRVSWRPRAGYHFYVGYCRFSGEIDWRICLAPFAAGLGLALGALWTVPAAEAAFGWHGWAAAVIACWLSPTVDLAWALGKWLFLGRGDFARAVGP